MNIYIFLVEITMVIVANLLSSVDIATHSIIMNI